jgi:hypothetical protein
MRNHLYFATAPGNGTLYVAVQKNGVVRQLPVIERDSVILSLSFSLLSALSTAWERGRNRQKGHDKPPWKVLYHFFLPSNIVNMWASPTNMELRWPPTILRNPARSLKLFKPVSCFYPIILIWKNIINISWIPSTLLIGLLGKLVYCYS